MFAKLRRVDLCINSAGSRRAQLGCLLLSCCAAAIFLATSCGRSIQPSNVDLVSADWHEFQGTWTAAGTRSTLHLGGSRLASISTFTGSLLLAGPSRPGIGFRSEAIVFSDSETGVVGRAVWTDEHGDQAVSELRGEGKAEKNNITGTFVGGTGRYASATGMYEFSWRFLIENEDGVVQGQSIGLKGRVRVNSTQVMSLGGSASWAIPH